MMKLLIAIGIFFIAKVSAQALTVTSPSTGSTYNAGDSMILSWINPKGSVIGSINLMKGAATSLVPILMIGSNVDASSGSFRWDIPSLLDPGIDYVIAFQTESEYAYSSFFTVNSAGSSSASSSAPSTTPTFSSTIPLSSSAISRSGPQSSSTVSSTADLPNDHESGSDDGGSASPGVIAGAVVGGIGGVGLFIVVPAIFCFYKRRKNQKQDKGSGAAYLESGAPPTDKDFAIEPSSGLDTKNGIPNSQNSTSYPTGPPPISNSNNDVPHSNEYTSHTPGSPSVSNIYSDVPHSQDQGYREHSIPQSAGAGSRQDVLQSLEQRGGYRDLNHKVAKPDQHIENAPRLMLAPVKPDGA